MYMKALSGENAEEYFKAKDGEIQGLMRRYTWNIVLSKSVSDHNVFPGIWSIKCKRKPYWNISKFKAQYCVRWYSQKRLSPEPLNSYFPVLQWDTVGLMLIF